MAQGKPKGSPKTGGREKGAKNIAGGTAKKKIADFLDTKLDNLEEIYTELPNATEQSKFLLGLLPYVVGKEQKIDVTSDGEKLMTWIITPVKNGD